MYCANGVRMLARLTNHSRTGITPATIKQMHKMVEEGLHDPATIAEARAIARTVPPRNSRAIAAQILNYVRRKIHYVKDPVGVELVGGTRWLRSVKAGDCDEMSILIGAYAAACGIPYRFVTLAVKDPAEWDHVYVQLQINGNQVELGNNQFIVDLRTLTSDDIRRDNRIRKIGLQSNTFPWAKYTATAIEAFPEDAAEAPGP